MDDIKPNPNPEEEPTPVNEPAPEPNPTPAESPNPEVPGVDPATAPAPEPVFGMHDPSADAPPAPKSRTKVITPQRSMILALIVLLLIALGAFAYYRFVYLSPAHIAERAFTAALKVKGFTYDVNVEDSEASSDRTEETTSAFHASGTVDWHDRGNPLVSLKASGKDGADNYGGETRLKDFVSYAQITEVPESAGDLASLTNKWVSLDAHDAQRGWDDWTEKVNKFAAERGPAIKEALSKHEIIVVDKMLKSEKVGGEPCWHFTFRVDKGALKAAGPDLNKAVTGKEMTSDERKNFDRDVDGYSFDTKGTEVWLGKHDNLLHKIHSDTNEEGSHLKATLTLTDYNQPKNLDKPSEAQDLDTFVKNEVSKAGPDHDHDGLSDIAETIYATDSNASDSDQDGHPDGAEVAAGYNPAGPGKAMPLADHLGESVAGETYFAFFTLLGSINSGDSKSSAESSRVKSDILQLKVALANYYSDKNEYPSTASKRFPVAIGASLERTLVPDYLEILPTDPRPGKKYIYISDGKSFGVCADLADGTFFQVGPTQSEEKPGQAETSCEISS